MQFRGKRVHQQSFLMPTLAEQLDRRQPLRKLADAIPREAFEKEFGEYYSEEGRPAKSVRLMVGLLLLKQMFNVSDERVVELWVQNPCWQYFCGMKEFQWELPLRPE
jgi:IS5 family transposase